VKEQGLDGFAQRFVAAGMVVLAFDHRHLGASDGDERGRIVFQKQHNDIRAALGWLARQPGIDGERIGLWGSSYSGAHVIFLGAFDPRVKVVVSQVPGLDVFSHLIQDRRPRGIPRRPLDRTWQSALSADRVPDLRSALLGGDVTWDFSSARSGPTVESRPPGLLSVARESQQGPYPTRSQQPAQTDRGRIGITGLGGRQGAGQHGAGVTSPVWAAADAVGDPARPEWPNPAGTSRRCARTSRRGDGSLLLRRSPRACRIGTETVGRQGCRTEGNLYPPSWFAWALAARQTTVPPYRRLTEAILIRAASDAGSPGTLTSSVHGPAPVS
jgi:X-Pro dipeptidyl-peptidase (S15 family)